MSSGSPRQSASTEESSGRRNTTTSGGSGSAKCGQINSSNNYKALFKKFDQNAIHMFESKIPLLERRPQKYYPMAYVFRLPDADVNRNKRKSLVARARCPPFAVQFDHAIAVVWSLYLNEELETPLGINQLHWAYSFLQHIRNKEHSHPPDIAHCLQTITDELLSQYAELVDIAKPARKRPGSKKESAEPPPSNAEKTAKTSSSCQCHRQSEVHFEDEADECPHVPGMPPCSETMKAAAAPTHPFSFTYADMKLHQGTSESTSPPPDNECHAAHKVDSFLFDWRKEQLRKIKTDLNHLMEMQHFMMSPSATKDPKTMNAQEKRMYRFVNKKFESTNCNCKTTIRSPKSSSS